MAKKLESLYPTNESREEYSLEDGLIKRGVLKKQQQGEIGCKNQYLEITIEWTILAS